MSAVVKIVLALAAVALIWQGWEHIGLLRGTWLNDVRLVLLFAAAFLVLSIAEWISGWVSRLFGGST